MCIRDWCSVVDRKIAIKGRNTWGMAEARLRVKTREFFTLLLLQSPMVCIYKYWRGFEIYILFFSQSFLSYWFSFSSSLLLYFSKMQLYSMKLTLMFFHSTNDKRNIIFLLGSGKCHAITLMKIIFVEPNDEKNYVMRFYIAFNVVVLFVFFLQVACFLLSLFLLQHVL